MVKPSKGRTYAAIDIGTNSAHLVVATIESEGVFNTLDSDKVILRLGEDLDENFNLTADAFKRTIDAIKYLKQVASAYDPHYRCIATHAIRQAKNRNDLIERVLRETSIQIEVVDGIEEARLVAVGMRLGIPSTKETFLGVDIGGGSTELVISSESKIDFISSLKLGAVVLTNQFFNKSLPSTRDIRRLGEFVKNQLAPLKNDILALGYSKAIISSGTAKAIATIEASLSSKKSISDIHGYEVSAESLKALTRKIRSLRSPRKIRAEFDVDQARSEIILAGAVILDGVTSLFEVKQWTVSTYGLREGLVIDTYRRDQISNMTDRTETRPAEPHQDVRWQNVNHLGRKLQIDSSQSERVMKIALRLYDELENSTPEKPSQASRGSHPESQLTPHLSDRDILGFAAWLHECGKFISFPKYHKHSKYLIINSKLMGFTQEEREFIGLVARFHRKGLASPTRRDCRFLSHPQIRNINYLAGILRMAAILSRTRKEIFSHIHIKVDTKGLCRVLVLRYNGLTYPDAEIHRFLSEKPEIEQSIGFATDIILEIDQIGKKT